MTTQSSGLSETAERILSKAITWMDDNPGEFPTTRKLCELAGVTAPTLYHHFGDKEGLMLAVAERKMLSFFQGKKRQPETSDPEADLLKGWDQWIDFAHKHLALIGALQQSPAISARLRMGAEAIAMGRLERLHQLKPLRIPPQQAAQTVVAASNVVIQLMLQGMPAAQVKAVNAELQQAVFLALKDR